MTQSFFNSSSDSLSEKLRPTRLEDVIGQKALKSGAGTWINQVQSGQLINLIFWGPPGSGKTSAALCFAELTHSRFVVVQATDLSTQKIRELIDEAKYHRSAFQKKTLLFIDEIHRLTKLQQDGFLSALEKGEIYLIGATTENPFYELNRALLSRCFIQQFEPLNSEGLNKIYKKALDVLDLKDEILENETLLELTQLANGDARKFINSLEICYQFFLTSRTPVNLAQLGELMNQSPTKAILDKSYKSDLISAFIKSVRGSHPDAALLYLAQALEAGEEPLYYARRLIILASEDVGNADPRALLMATAAFQACELVGMPEARIPLSQVTVYLCCCPKSNSSYVAIGEALKYVQKRTPVKIPEFLKSSTYSLGEKINAYETPHQAVRGWNSQNYLSDEHQQIQFYKSNSRGFEKQMDEYLAWLYQNEKPKS